MLSSINSPLPPVKGIRVTMHFLHRLWPTSATGEVKQPYPGADAVTRGMFIPAQRRQVLISLSRTILRRHRNAMVSSSAMFGLTRGV